MFRPWRLAAFIRQKGKKKILGVTVAAGSSERAVNVFVCERSEWCSGCSAPSALQAAGCWWLTVEQLGDLRSSESGADVTARLGSDSLSQTVINDSISLDMMGTLSRLHWLIAWTFFFSPQRVRMCFSYLQSTRERKHLSIEPQQRSCPTI